MKRVILIVVMVVVLLSCGFVWGDWHGKLTMQPVIENYSRLTMSWEARALDLEDTHRNGAEIYRQLQVRHDVALRDYKLLEGELVQLNYELAEEREKPPVFVDVPITVTEIERVVVNREYEDWDSLDELKQFIAEHEDEVATQALRGRDGVIQFSGQCVGWAMGWRDMAAEYGKNLEVNKVTPIEYRRVFSKYPPGGSRVNHHAVLLAIVDEADLYFIEPENGEIRLASYVP